MGVFSWCTSDTKKSIPCCIPFGDLPGTVYLLNPFGEPYKETDYEGYGVFGGRDVYELVVEWNQEYLTPDNISKPDRSEYAPGETGDAFFARALEEYSVACAAIKAYASGVSDEYMKEVFGAQLGYAGYADDWKRCLGIKIACYEQDHVKLKYPIKIVEHPMEYEKAGISPDCPFQGCMYPDSMMEIRREVGQAFASLAMYVEKQRVSSIGRLNEKPSLTEQESNTSFASGDLVNYKGRTWVVDKTLNKSGIPSGENCYSILPLEYQDPDKYDDLIKSGEYEQVARKVPHSELVNVQFVEQVIFSKEKAPLDAQIEAAKPPVEGRRDLSEASRKEEPEL